MTLDRALRLGHDATRQDLYEARLVLIDTIIELRKQLARATGTPRWPGDEPKYGTQDHEPKGG